MCIRDRYVVSLESADRKIFMSVSLLLLVGCMVIFFVVLSNTYFIRSIVKPLGKISAVARRIAQGDFKVRIRKSHDDEIGDLCDTINDMAQELGASEKMKNDFISSVSHELRTPLTAIKGWAETMKMTGPADAVTMEKGMSIIAVSYTHLDVYKRQSLYWKTAWSPRKMYPRFHRCYCSPPNRKPPSRRLKIRIGFFPCVS